MESLCSLLEKVQRASLAIGLYGRRRENFFSDLNDVVFISCQW